MNISPMVETQFLDVPGGRLAYDVSGPEFGRLVLCTPGMGDIRQAYRFMVQPLVTAGHRVVLMDQRATASRHRHGPAMAVRLPGRT